MHKVTYTYTHPTDIVTAMVFSPEEVVYRTNFLTYAHLHGLVFTETRVVSPVMIVHEAVWDTVESWCAIQAYGGDAYAAFVQRIKTRLEAGGGTFNVAET